MKKQVYFNVIGKKFFRRRPGHQAQRPGHPRRTRSAEHPGHAEHIQDGREKLIKPSLYKAYKHRPIATRPYYLLFVSIVQHVTTPGRNVTAPPLHDAEHLAQIVYNSVYNRCGIGNDPAGKGRYMFPVNICQV